MESEFYLVISKIIVCQSDILVMSELSRLLVSGTKAFLGRGAACYREKLRNAIWVCTS